MYSVEDVLLVVCVTIGAVILINVGIIVALRKGGKNRVAPYKTLGKAINVARNPWKKEEEQISELSDLIESIKEDSDQDE